MQTGGDDQAIGSLTTDSLRERARAAADTVRDGIARVAAQEPEEYAQRSDQLASMYGTLDRLDSIVRAAIREQSSPTPQNLLDLHALLGGCMAAIVDLAGAAPNPDNPDFRSSVGYASARAQRLLDFAGALD